jgi:hypothetical protein
MRFSYGQHIALLSHIQDRLIGSRCQSGPIHEGGDEPGDSGTRAKMKSQAFAMVPLDFVRYPILAAGASPLREGDLKTKQLL